MSRGTVCALFMLAPLMASGVGAELQVNSYTEHHQTHPAVAMNDDGDFVVVWRSHVADGRGGGVYARCFDANGAATCEEFQVNASPVDVDNWSPTVAMSPSGDFVVAWVAARNQSTEIVAKMYDRQGLSLTDEFLVSDGDATVACSMPAAAMNTTGQFVVVYTRCPQEGLVRARIAGRLYGPAATPATEEFLVDELPQGNWPDVGMDESGSFVVSWIRMGDTWNRPYGEYIQFRRYEADGTPVGDVVAVTGDLNSRWYGPSLAVDDSGEFVIAWAAGPFPYDIIAQHFAAEDTPATEPYVMNTCLEGNQGHPQVATSGAGEYLCVWDSQDQDGSGYGVFSQRCKAGAELCGSECCINTYVLDRQWYPDVAMASDGRCVVVWISEDQDGSGYGVFAEIGTQ